MSLKSQLKSLVHSIRYLLAYRYAGSGRYCAVCDHQSKRFLPYGVEVRSDALCPFCRSLERHRLVIRFLREKTNLFDGAPKRFLHVAPERSLERVFSRALGSGYLTADLFDDGVMEKMDITNIQHADASFDVVYCSHVLEHVPDDRKAIREFYRVLRPTGWAVLNVPVTAEQTFEDPTITDPKERERLFGQHDHVRRYGPDYKDRLEEAGFSVSVVYPSDFMTPDEVETQGVANDATGEVFFCTKT